MAHPGGRPTIYSLELAKKVCRAISVTSKSIASVCDSRDDLPGASTIWEWRLDNEEFADLYIKAKKARVELLVDEMTTIADDTSNDKKINAEGKEVVNNECVNRSRLRIDTRKWLVSKMQPAIYGDKIVQENKQDQTQFQQIIDIQLHSDLKRKEEAYLAREQEIAALKKSLEKDQ